MQDLEFYNIPIGGRGLGDRLLAPFRRIARKLLLPFFKREVEIMAELARGIEEGARAHQSLGREEKSEDVGASFWEYAHRVESLDNKSECLNVKFDQLNRKFDQLNTKMESLLAKFEELRGREDELRSEFAALVGMHWDHLALGRRLGQLEDRLIAGEASESSPTLDDTSILFPGLERLQRPQAG